jgi:hypothetical protein
MWLPLLHSEYCEVPFTVEPVETVTAQGATQSNQSFKPILYYLVCLLYPISIGLTALNLIG